MSTPFALRLEHTLLRPDASTVSLKGLVDEAAHLGTRAVCVLPHAVDTCLAHPALGERVLVSVAAFPYGAAARAAKVTEIRALLEAGVAEVDVVLDWGAWTRGDAGSGPDEIKALAVALGDLWFRVKVILETGMLALKKLQPLCDALNDTRAFCAKTSTGCVPAGASVEAVRYLREHLHPAVRVKASGGITERAFADRLVEAGADFIGTSRSATLLG